MEHRWNTEFLSQQLVLHVGDSFPKLAGRSSQPDCPDIATHYRSFGQRS